MIKTVFSTLSLYTAWLVAGMATFVFFAVQAQANPAENDFWVMSGILSLYLLMLPMIYLARRFSATGAYPLAQLTVLGFMIYILL